MTAEEYENFPLGVKAILSTYSDNEDLYKECVRIKHQLEVIGWTCDYDLSGEVYDVKPKSLFFKDLEEVLELLYELEDKFDYNETDIGKKIGKLINKLQNK
jgi:hypothetical protein